VYSFAINGDNIFAGTSHGVYLSTNNGNDWNIVNDIIPIDYKILSIAFCGNTLLAATDGSSGKGGIYRSTNNGLNWTYAGLVNTYIASLAVFGNGIFVTTLFNGVYYSNDNGTSWNKVNDGLILSNGTMFNKFDCLATNGTYIFAGGDGTGVGRRSLSEFTGVTREINNLPGQFNLEQNYPNPFNPGTIIKYSVPKAGNIKLTVYNSIGSKVATIVNEYKIAGNYSIQFNASNLASGIYFYRLESGNYTSAKKFILIK